MINVETVYQSVRDLSTKGKGGYSDTDEFNKTSRRAELMLWKYYCSMYEMHHQVAAAMHPFLAEQLQQIGAGGRFDVPADCEYLLEVKYATIVNGTGGCGSEPSATYTGVRYLKKDEEQWTVSNAVRRPSLTRGRMYYAYAPGGKMQFYPDTATGSVALQYFRYPVFASREFSINVTTDEQEYDSVNSINYEWPESEENNLIDLMLMFTGIIIRDTGLITWASQHQAVSQNIIK